MAVGDLPPHPDSKSEGSCVNKQRREEPLSSADRDTQGSVE